MNLPDWSGFHDTLAHRDTELCHCVCNQGGDHNIKQIRFPPTLIIPNPQALLSADIEKTCSSSSQIVDLRSMAH